jgi:hypothetical protein
MSHAEISLVYEGQEVENGRMDVRDLAPALLSFGNLIEAANRVVNGDNSVAKIQVRTVSAGSFSIGFDVAIDFLKTVRDFLSGPEATAAANLLGVLTRAGAVGVGAISLVRQLKGHTSDHARSKSENRVEIDIEGVIIEVDEIVARVAFDSGVRAALERIVAEPLGRDGIDAVVIGIDENIERIEKAEAYAFKPPIDREGGAYEHRFRAPFSIVSLSFKQGNKWRLNDGRATLNVTVVDNDFIYRVDRSEISFSKGDILICDVRVVTREVAGGLHAEFFIERVVEQRKPLHQMLLFEKPE